MQRNSYEKTSLHLFVLLAPICATLGRHCQTAMLCWWHSRGDVVVKTHPLDINLDNIQYYCLCIKPSVHTPSFWSTSVICNYYSCSFHRNFLTRVSFFVFLLQLNPNHSIPSYFDVRSSLRISFIKFLPSIFTGGTRWERASGWTRRRGGGGGGVGH